MSKYDRINKEQIIQLSELEYKYRDAQWKYIDGDIVETPDKELEKKRCKLLIDAYAVLAPYEKDILADYEKLEPYPIIIDKERDFIQSAYHLCSIYHEEIREIEDIYGRQDIDLAPLKEYFTKDFVGIFFDGFVERFKERRGKWTKADIARIAYLIFTSDKFNKRNGGTVFTKWHNTFCDIVGAEYAEYKPARLKKEIERDVNGINSYFIGL